MKKRWVFLILVTWVAGSAATAWAAEPADTFRGEADAAGVAVLWFAVQDVTVDLRADVSLRATISVGGASLSFAATGRAVGTGSANLESLAVVGWLVVSGEGTTGAGAPLTVRGGLSIDALEPGSMTSSSARGSGRFYFLITTPSGSWAVEGDAVGGAAGTFVVPDDPQSMQMNAAGTFMLTGESRPWPSDPSDALPDWPEALLAEIARQSAAADGAGK